MIVISHDGEASLDLAALVVPRAGELRETGDPWEPYRLVDPDGLIVTRSLRTFQEALQVQVNPSQAV